MKLFLFTQEAIDSSLKICKQVRENELNASFPYLFTELCARKGSSLLWGQQSTRTNCPERLWSILHWSYSKPTWMRSCARRTRRPIWQLVWIRCLPEVPSNLIILWLCDSVKVKFLNWVVCLYSKDIILSSYGEHGFGTQNLFVLLLIM